MRLALILPQVMAGSNHKGEKAASDLALGRPCMVC
jgi:hypothetical protein